MTRKIVFSKKNFELNAPSYVKRLVSELHREALEGKTVVFTEEYGTVDYQVNGEDYTLYPVDRNWCEVSE